MRWIPSWKFVLGSMFGVASLLVVAFAVFYAVTPIPAAKADALSQTSLVFYSDGTQIGQFKKEQRTVVPLSRVPDHVRDAVLAIEDRTFYDNRGVSPRGMIRAAWNNARGGDVQGGSTITQQYVKNFFLTTDRTIQRKAREFVISLKVAQQVPKDKILEDYLNKIYFGRNAYGIQAAARAYFGKDVDKLTVSEGAFLAGIINSPESYDPADGPQSTELATERWTAVLTAMTEEGWLDPTQAQQVTAAGLPQVRKATAGADRTRQRGYLMDMVLDEYASRMGLTREEAREKLETGGYQIRTTFDKAMINKGIEAVEETLGKRSTWPEGTQVSIAAVEPGTGAVKAVYAGDDKRFANGVTQDRVISGSTFKPFTLIAALEGNESKGVEPLSLRSRFSGRSPYKVDGSDLEFKNFGRGNGQQFGMIDLLTATANSVNTVYVQLNEEVGPEQTRKVAVRAGLPEDTEDLTDEQGNDYLSNVLGSAAPHVLDMAFAYSTFAAEGQRPKQSYVISSVARLADQGVEYAYKPKAEPVFDPDVIADATYAMQQVIRRGSGSYASNLGRPAAGKTGTSSDNKSAWFTGFTPQLATAVAIYNISGSGQSSVEGWGRYAGQEITGGSFPVRVWTTFMRAALEGTEVQRLPEPAYGGEPVNPAPPPAPTPTAEPSPSGEASPSPSEVSPAPSPEGPIGTSPPEPPPGEPPNPSPTPIEPPTANRGNGNGGAAPQPAA